MAGGSTIRVEVVRVAASAGIATPMVRGAVIARSLWSLLSRVGGQPTGSLFARYAGATSRFGPSVCSAVARTAVLSGKKLIHVKAAEV